MSAVLTKMLVQSHKSKFLNIITVCVLSLGDFGVKVDGGNVLGGLVKIMIQKDKFQY